MVAPKVDSFAGLCVRAIAVAGALLLSMTAAAQGNQNSLFAETDTLLRQAKEARAALLSPENYADALEAYEDAEVAAAKGREDRVQEDLADCNEALRNAIQISKLAELTFADALEARELASIANAAKYAPELWSEAEETFNAAAEKLEDDNVKKAQAVAADAKVEYGTAELTAIKTAILGNTWQLIAQADEDDIGKYAPLTLADAKELAAAAESDLEVNRYTTAGPQGMAAEAEYQVRHARYIASQVQALDDDKLSGEELLLQWEKPLRDVAGALGATTDMTAGYAEPGVQSLQRAQILTRQNIDMAARISELEIALGSTEMVVEEAERMQRQLRELETLFAPDEARILREGNNLIIRLVGLSFPVGQAVIEAQYFALMRKVQEAIRMFPGAQVLIEGHTDSSGSGAANMELSQERASAVREYLVANQVVQGSNVAAIGYGKTRPVASNEDEAGRAENRRIDVVIEDARNRFGG